MLVLARKAGEKIIINENITIMILSINGGHVKVGVDAPKDISVDREEVFEKKQKESKDFLNNKNI
ncbi:carbon storage regulator CsrA [bacterium]|nr:carbon storage regulator CsrA [bacterium]